MAAVTREHVRSRIAEPATAPDPGRRSIVFDGPNQINDFTSRLMLGTDKYIRVNPQLDQTFSMDDCGAIPAILAATERFMATDEWRLQSTRINELFGD